MGRPRGLAGQSALPLRPRCRASAYSGRTPRLNRCCLATRPGPIVSESPDGLDEVTALDER